MIFSEDDFSDIVTEYLYSLDKENKTDLKIFLTLFKKADFNITNILFDKVKNDKNDKITTSDIRLTHKAGGNNFNLDFSKESLGTQKYFSLIGLLMILLLRNHKHITN
ncbi:hypothetical protein [Chryseobacterium indoltheticum]|uniref:hypothetical protein n=1 Tax=Chryseobacterium indoltheticum TaxID=254 RepID=UPI003F4919E6